MPEPQVFISYSHSDRLWKDRLLSHLRPLEKAGLLSTWHDGDIPAGVDWLCQLEHVLASAKVAILLVTADFLGSDFILRTEIPALLKRRRRDGLHVLPVITKACYWEQIEWLAMMEIRPLYGKPLAGHRANQRDTQLAAIAADVSRFVANVHPQGDVPGNTGLSLGEFTIAPLEDQVERFFGTIPHISTLEGFVLNSGRFFERYLQLAKTGSLVLEDVRFIVPSRESIRSAYRGKSRVQSAYLTETIHQFEAAWQNLERDGVVRSVDFRQIDCFPRNLCVIRNGDLVLTGLYERDLNHPLGLTCQRSWFHGSSNDSHVLARQYAHWFAALWGETAAH